MDFMINNMKMAFNQKQYHAAKWTQYQNNFLIVILHRSIQKSFCSRW